MKNLLTVTLILSVPLAVPEIANADIVVDYTVDAGGNSGGPLNGLAARGTFSLDGTTLNILLENTSTGIPDSFDGAAQLLVSIGFNLPDSVLFESGDSAIIGPGSIGLGTWGDRGEGDSVAEEWIWTNMGGGDLMAELDQIISTSSGQQSGNLIDFNGKKNANVDGPWGGIAVDPPFLNIPDNQMAVSDSIRFSLTLTEIITEEQLSQVAHAAIVEFGSDNRYLRFPAPGALGLFFAAGFIGKRRKR